MSKISRYCIAIFLSIFIEQLFINNHTICMQAEAALLWWRHKNKHIKCYRAREGEAGPGVGGEGGGGRDTVHWYIYRYTVLPKWYKEVSSRVYL